MKNMKKAISLLLAVLMMASLSITAFADEVDFTGNTMTGSRDFTYTVTHESSYTDLSAVKLEWSVPVLKYTKTDTRTWNPATLKWVQDFVNTTKDDGVTFTLANRGTYDIDAEASFSPATKDSAEVEFTGNEVTVPSIVNTNRTLKTADGATKEQRNEYVEKNCTKTISGKVTIVPEKLTAASGKLGTYTVKITGTASTYVGALYNASNEKVAELPLAEAKADASGAMAIFKAYNTAHPDNKATKIVLDGGTTSIKEEAFFAELESTGLESIEIPKTVTSIGLGAFAVSPDLKNISFEEGSKLTSIGWDAFSQCANLESITIPKGVTEIEGDTFLSCSRLATVSFEVGSKLTTIGEKAFRNCSALTSITIPKGVKSIGTMAFDCCALYTVSFEAGSELTTIGENAFASCTNLESITIPKGVKSIGAEVWGNALEKITFEGTVAQWNAINFGSNLSEDCGHLETITITGDTAENNGNYTLNDDNTITEKVS